MCQIMVHPPPTPPPPTTHTHQSHYSNEERPAPVFPSVGILNLFEPAQALACSQSELVIHHPCCFPGSRPVQFLWPPYFPDTLQWQCGPTFDPTSSPRVDIFLLVIINHVLVGHSETRVDLHVFLITTEHPTHAQARLQNTTPIWKL